MINRKIWEELKVLADKNHTNIERVVDMYFEISETIIPFAESLLEKQNEDKSRS